MQFDIYCEKHGMCAGTWPNLDGRSSCCACLEEKLEGGEHVAFLRMSRREVEKLFRKTDAVDTPRSREVAAYLREHAKGQRACGYTQRADVIDECAMMVDED